MTFSKQKTGTPPLVLLNEPYTPVIQSISLSYKAHSDVVNIESDSISLDAFSNSDLHFYHIAYFGQRREHGYLRKQCTFLANTEKSVSLLPVYSNEGELLIGLKTSMPG